MTVWCRRRLTVVDIRIPAAALFGVGAGSRASIAGRRGSIGLKNSIFALEAGQQRGQRVCYMFEGFITGAFSFLLGIVDPTAVECEETYCACDGRHDHCRFDFMA